MKILLTGGSGKLGTELQKHMTCYAPSREVFDVTNLDLYATDKPDLVIHAAAYTNVKEAEKRKWDCYELNVFGTTNTFSLLSGTPFVFISSEYAHNPVNYYGETKLAAETAIKAIDWPYLIIRTLFKPNPYPHDYAFIDQFTQGDYVDVIAKLIADAVKVWDKKTSKTIYVGTGRKSMYELAKQTKPDVKPNRVDDVVDFRVPKDYE